MLNSFRLYRKIRGGIWRKIMIKRFNVPDFWTRNKTPFNEEVVIKEEDHRFSDTKLVSYVNEVISTTKINTNLISDGYHTFGELYEHRIVLYIALCKAEDVVSGGNSWRSKLHSDGSVWDGWFILGINKKAGCQITYHLPMSKWNDCEFAETLEKTPEWDGHTSEDVLKRIKDLF
jgi:hypothetical protein